MENKNILAEIDQKISAASRNANQGELGRTLAMNKINEMKLALIQLKGNFLTEAKQAVTNKAFVTDDITDTAEAPVFSLAQKKTNLSSLEHSLAEIKSRIPKVQQLEVDLGLDEDVKDSELIDTQNAIEEAYNKARSSVKNEAVDEAKAR